MTLAWLRNKALRNKSNQYKQSMRFGDPEPDINNNKNNSNNNKTSYIIVGSIVAVTDSIVGVYIYYT